MTNNKKLLVLSNGHGEDIIAVRILEQLQNCPNPPQLAALPIVGEGHAYVQSKIPIIGPVQQMPSGGFIYMDRRQFWRDIKGGLLQLTLSQYQTVRQWGNSDQKILAVGDIIPLLFAWLSGADYAFVGTAKSEYYWRDESDWLPTTSCLERSFGSVYLPWERWLMRYPRCKAVFARDTLTTKILQQFSIPAFDLGNPMMDGIIPLQNSNFKMQNNSLIILLLPGSRLPEAVRNWQKILQAVSGVLAVFPEQPILLLSAIAPALQLAPFQEILLTQGWITEAISSISISSFEADSLPFTNKNGTLLLTQSNYVKCLQLADLAIAMAGTATEQFVGLGKPAITMVGEGPQFTDIFAKAQTRLLGSSIILLEKPEEVASTIPSLLQNSKRLQQIAENGRRRMGTPGAAARIARCLQEKLFV